MTKVTFWGMAGHSQITIKLTVNAGYKTKQNVTLPKSIRTAFIWSYHVNVNKLLNFVFKLNSNSHLLLMYPPFL